MLNFLTLIHQQYAFDILISHHHCKFTLSNNTLEKRAQQKNKRGLGLFLSWYSPTRLEPQSMLMFNSGVSGPKFNTNSKDSIDSEKVKINMFPQYYYGTLEEKCLFCI